MAVGRPGEAIDLGIISMHRTQPLQVVLTSTTPVDFTQFETNADGNAPYPRIAFDQAGLATWPQAGPNVYYVRVFLPDDSWMSLERYCRPGENWKFTFPLDPRRTVDVTVVNADGTPWKIDPLAWVSLSYIATGGHQLIHRVGPSEAGRAHFGSVAAARVYAEVIGGDGDRLGAQSLALEEGANEVRLVLGGKSVRVHVTDPDGAAVDGATLDARMPSGELPWFQLSSTDAAGFHTFTGLGMKKLFINVQHDQFGVKSDVEVDLDTWKSEDTLEIQLDPRATVAVRLLDGAAPVPAANVRLLGPQSHHILGVFSSDSAGVVRYGPVAPGSYLLAVEQPGIWPVEKLVEAGDKDHPIDVQVRKLGGLALKLTNTAGDPVAGIRVELEATEGGGMVSDWIQRGLVQVAGGELVSDASGMAVVDRIPHGDYSVRLTSQAGSYVAGRVTVNVGAPTNAAFNVQ